MQTVGPPAQVETWKPHMALRSKLRGTAGRMSPCRVCLLTIAPDKANRATACKALYGALLSLPMATVSVFLVRMF